MNTVLEEIIKTQQVRPVDGSDSIPLHSAISDEQGLFLQDLVRQVDPKVNLEVGLAFGISALYICDALRIREGTQHIAIDPYQHECGATVRIPDSPSTRGSWGNGIGMANLRRAGFGDIVQLIEKPSHLALPELEMAGREVDLAFIDGMHLFDFALIDFFYIDHMLRVGGIIAFDDVWLPAVRKVCRFVATNRPYSVVGTCGANSWRRRTSERVLGTMPFCRSNFELGIRGRCVAFRKEKHDDRLWNHFNRF
jgi:predicted O-methyltransferase YrrM